MLSDHGEEFLEHDGWNHGETLYQEQLWVPWVMHVPDEAGRRVRDRLVSLVDFGPTLLALLDKEAPAGWAGTNALAPASDFSTRALFSQTDIRYGAIFDEEARSEAVRVGNMKLIETVNGAECYDLGTDPGEQSPLISDAACAGHLRQELSAFRDRNAALGEHGAENFRRATARIAKEAPKSRVCEMSVLARSPVSVERRACDVTGVWSLDESPPLGPNSPM